MLSLLLFAVAVAAQCTLPNTPLSSTITEPFGIQVQNPAFPEIHNRYLYLWEAGGGDKHLYLNPAGVPATTLTLDAGVLELGPLFAVINGEYTAWDNTTKLFTTQRGDPRAIFAPTHACNPDTAAPQIELAFTGRQTSPSGGHICVRLASGNRHEFRYSPPQNPAHDPYRPCIPVVLALTRDVPPAPTAITTTTTTAGPPVVPSATAAPAPFRDVTALGWRFVGCAPEEGPAGDGLGRTLGGALQADDGLTNEVCVAFCRGRGFRFAGSEYRRECWCGNTLAETRVPGTTVASLAGCRLSCAGDGAQICGGRGWMSLYEACVEGACVNAEFGS
ncbi:hypothetical protein VD0003_g8014 [Verticillium dahliae]|nr:hypothetical protein VD0003_g8014 [Verticillium dahliae]